MQLSIQTLDGLNISMHSVVACVRPLLRSGAPFVLTEWFYQDPLELHFGHYWHKGAELMTFQPLTVYITS